MQKVNFYRAKNKLETKGAAKGNIRLVEIVTVQAKVLSVGSAHRFCLKAAMDSSDEGTEETFLFRAQLLLDGTEGNTGAGYNWQAKEVDWCMNDAPGTETPTLKVRKYGDKVPCEPEFHNGMLVYDDDPTTKTYDGLEDGCPMPSEQDLEMLERQVLPEFERGVPKWHEADPEELKLLPKSFDSRDNWPACRDTIDNVKNQGGCGSCYVFAGLGAASVTACTASANSKDPDLSLHPAQFETSFQQARATTHTTGPTLCCSRHPRRAT